jgi:hypothetical protein
MDISRTGDLAVPEDELLRDGGVGENSLPMRHERIAKRMGRSLSARSRRITASGKAFLQNDASTTGDASRFYNKGGSANQEAAARRTIVPLWPFGAAQLLSNGQIRKEIGVTEDRLRVPELFLYLIRTISIRPTAIMAAPAMRAIMAPTGASFSSITKPVSAAIQTRFITPTTKRIPISAQQQPRQ